MVMDSGSYVHNPDVDMSGYVSLDGRVKGACRCEKCSSLSSVRRWHLNDLVCEYDGELCDRDGKCYEKRRVVVGRRKRKNVYRLRVVKCSRCPDVFG
jgi:hypothetical protein